MKILYIAEKVPFPIYLDGGTLMNYHLLKGLKKNHSIDFISFSNKAVPNNFIEKLCHNYYGITQNNSLNKIHYLKGAISLLPPIYFNKSKEFANKLNELVSNNKYDIVFTDTIYMDVYTSNIVHPNKIISLHDSLSLLYKTFIPNTRNIFYLIYFGFCSYVFKRKELEILKSYSKCIFVSDKDEKHLANKNLNFTNTYTVPNGVNEDLINRENSINFEPNSIVFSGVMDYKPNIDAVLYFVDTILPLILKENSEVKFYIIGKNPTNEVNALTSENVIVTGWVEDISEYICKGAIYVSPLISGAGLKNKILEAMALRTAIVATSLSLDGIMVNDDEHLYIADTPKLFAERVLELLKDKKNRGRLIANSYELILEKYTWKNIIQKYEIEIFK
jgi:glycosyltransferase involved in cell wall biosynthesis